MKLFDGINDYELLYYINEGSEWALKKMLDKYKHYIGYKIKNLNCDLYYEDLFEEGMAVLYKAIRKYDDKYNKSFMRYFDLLLTNRFNTMIKKRIAESKALKELNYLYSIDDSYIDYIYDVKEIYNGLNDGIEKMIYEFVYLNDYSLKDISEILNCDIKKVYNSAYRVKNKIKKFNNKDK